METPSLFALGYGLGEGRQLESNRAVEGMKTISSFSGSILHGNISDQRENFTLSYWKTWISCNFLCLKPFGYHHLLPNKPHLFAPLRSTQGRTEHHLRHFWRSQLTHITSALTSLRKTQSMVGTRDHTCCKMDWTIINMAGCSYATEEEERMGFNGRLEFSRSSVIDQLHKDHSSSYLYVFTLKMWCWGSL